MRKIGIYIRVSTEKQAQSVEGSLKSQRQRLETEVSRKNDYEKDWGKIIDYYVDEARSGKDLNRPEFQRMMHDIEKKRIDTIMFVELSRLSRSVKDFLNVIEFFEKNNSGLICLQHNFDTTTPSGKVFITILMALAQFERELTVERTKSNLHARALRGLCNGGSPVLGYDKDPDNKGNRIINKKEAAIVQNIFNIFEETGSTFKTTKVINEKGYRTKTYVTSNGKSKGDKKFTQKPI